MLISFMSSLMIFLLRPISLFLDGAGRVPGLAWSCTCLLYMVASVNLGSEAAMSSGMLVENYHFFDYLYVLNRDPSIPRCRISVQTRYLSVMVYL